MGSRRYASPRTRLKKIRDFFCASFLPVIFFGLSFPFVGPSLSPCMCISLPLYCTPVSVSVCRSLYHVFHRLSGLYLWPLPSLIMTKHTQAGLCVYPCHQNMLSIPSFTLLNLYHQDPICSFFVWLLFSLIYGLFFSFLPKSLNQILIVRRRCSSAFMFSLLHGEQAVSVTKGYSSAVLSTFVAFFTVFCFLQEHSSLPCATNPKSENARGFVHVVLKWIPTTIWTSALKQ